MPVRARVIILLGSALVVVLAMLLAVEAAVLVGPARARVLLHDGEVVLGLRVPAGAGAASGLRVGLAPSLFDPALLPGVRVQSPIYEVAAPLWMPLALVAGWTFVGWRRASRRAAWQCDACGYDLRGAGDPGADRGATRCPECGGSRSAR